MVLCDELLQQSGEWFSKGFRVRSLGGSCLVDMPLLDSGGDSITVVVAPSAKGFIVHDGGAIAGHLFSLGQHTQNTLAFKLLRSLCQSYELLLDFDQGLVKTETSKESLIDTIFELTKIIVTMTTATTHIRPKR